MYFELLTFLILQVDYSSDNFLIEYRHLPHERLTQDLLSHKKCAILRAKNEISQISSETENVAILLSVLSFSYNANSPNDSKSRDPFVSLDARNPFLLKQNNCVFQYEFLQYNNCVF